MVTDALDPPGIYFGTRSGKLYASRDAGKTWQELLNGLPQIVCVATAVVGELAAPAKAKPTETRRRAPQKKTSKNGKSRIAKRKATRPTVSKSAEVKRTGRKRSRR
jgi:hypothetical protein